MTAPGSVPPSLFTQEALAASAEALIRSHLPSGWASNDLTPLITLWTSLHGTSRPSENPHLLLQLQAAIFHHSINQSQNQLPNQPQIPQTQTSSVPVAPPTSIFQQPQNQNQQNQNQNPFPPPSSQPNPQNQHSSPSTPAPAPIFHPTPSTPSTPSDPPSDSPLTHHLEEAHNLCRLYFLRYFRIAPYLDLIITQVFGASYKTSSFSSYTKTRTKLQSCTYTWKNRSLTELKSHVKGLMEDDPSLSLMAGEQWLRASFSAGWNLGIMRRVWGWADRVVDWEGSTDEAKMMWKEAYMRLCIAVVTGGEMGEVWEGCGELEAPGGIEGFKLVKMVRRAKDSSEMRKRRRGESMGSRTPVVSVGMERGEGAVPRNGLGEML
ncbi:hypothetical protein FPQ18DRAFT_308279 [Pyronema domesticum]|uniref:Uncharacterized protein n=1 Tax=Pyronema omphalodes (strain CBS 100304) TaxID=1076935 RepID=U4LKG7_PYROM|nr:hypothetical protein FPQ18DRAFT_308279 [Pyronema domesticum]CCX32072.1 Protein of unknown function [Pyronema omphalodes CBS 100304]